MSDDYELEKMFLGFFGNHIPGTVDGEMNKHIAEFLEKHKGESERPNPENIQELADSIYIDVAYRLGKRCRDIADAWRAGVHGEHRDIEIPKLRKRTDG